MNPNKEQINKPAVTTPWRMFSVLISNTFTHAQVGQDSR